MRIGSRWWRTGASASWAATTNWLPAKAPTPLCGTPGTAEARYEEGPRLPLRVSGPFAFQRLRSLTVQTADDENSRVDMWGRGESLAGKAKPDRQVVPLQPSTRTPRITDGPAIHDGPLQHEIG